MWDFCVFIFFNVNGLVRQSIEWMEPSKPVEWAPEVNKKTYAWVFIEIPRRLQILIRRPQVNKWSREVGKEKLLVVWEEIEDQLKASCTHHLIIHRLILTTSTHRRFSLYAVGMFSKVATNTGLMNSELRENRVRSLVSLWSQHWSVVWLTNTYLL